MKINKYYTMKKWNFLALALVALMLAACGTKSKEKTEEIAQKQPNVLFIAVDDLNMWLGCLNNYSKNFSILIDHFNANALIFFFVIFNIQLFVVL